MNQVTRLLKNIAGNMNSETILCKPYKVVCMEELTVGKLGQVQKMNAD